MKKKAIALPLAIELIAAIVFAIVVLYIFLKTGLLGTFKVYMATFLCTISSYGRGVIVDVIWKIWQMLSILITVALIISGVGNAVQSIAQNAGYWATYATLKSVLRFAGTTGLIMGAGLVSMTTIMTYIMIGLVISKIPFICPAMTVDVGYQNSPANLDKFMSSATSNTIDCFSMMGKGDMDPLMGVDPPNPRTCFTVEAFVNTNQIQDKYHRSYLTVKDVYDELLLRYYKTWPLGDVDSLKLYAYCNTGTGVQYLGNDPADWGSCTFNRTRLYIMFLDRHDYDIISYGSSVCGGEIDVGPWPIGEMNPDADSIVWCFEKI